MAALLELMTYNNEFLLDSGGDFILYDDGAGLDCCCVSACCGDCPWLETYHTSLGKLKVTFTSGPVTGYIILGPTSLTMPNACIQWATLDASNVTDTGDFLWGGANAVFWCEDTGASAVPLKLLMTMGNGACEVNSIGVDPEFSECTESPDTLTVRYRWTMTELIPGGCSHCGGTPLVCPDIVVEVTLYP